MHYLSRPLFFFGAASPENNYIITNIILLNKLHCSSYLHYFRPNNHYQGSHKLFESKFHDFSTTFHTSNFEIPGLKINIILLSIYYTTDYNYIYF